MVHDQAEASGRHSSMAGSAESYGLDALLGQEGVRLFEEAMELAESDEIRERVEKASIHTVPPGVAARRKWRKNRWTATGAGHYVVGSPSGETRAAAPSNFNRGYEEDRHVVSNAKTIAARRRSLHWCYGA
jgi:hypothetical protein